MRALANQAPTRGAIIVGKIKIPESKPFCGARDAKTWENFIFDIEQYFKAMNTIIEEDKVTLTTVHLLKMQSYSGDLGMLTFRKDVIDTIGTA